METIKGFHDVLPPQSGRRERFTRQACAVLETYGFSRIDLPLLEKGELFVRSVGATTDIVEKEMYSFADRDKEHTLLALRPEGTASVVRAFVDAGGARRLPEARLYYTGPMFRRERPQKGRLRQFHQIGAEAFGRDDPSADAEIICLVDDVCRAVGLTGVRIRINSLGDAACRPGYRARLAEWAGGRVDDLCGDCRARLQRNPLRILDCKNEKCVAITAEAPMMVDHLCEPCRVHYQRVLSLLSTTGPVVEQAPRLVRGLDYYCRTAFEITVDHPQLGAQNAIGGGGRYDGLVATLGGTDTAGIGFALGIERMELAGAGTADDDDRPEIVIIPISAEAEDAALGLARKLRIAGAVVLVGSAERKLKAQMKRADRVGAQYAVILGPDELATGRPALRDMIHKVDSDGCFDLESDAVAILERIRKVGTH